MKNLIYQLTLNGKNVATVEFNGDGKYNVNYSHPDDVHAFVGVMIHVIGDLPNGKAVIDSLPRIKWGVDESKVQ